MQIRIYFLIFLLFCAFSIHAQNTPLSINAYGVYDRGNTKDLSNPDYDYLIGVEIVPKWKDIQPTNPEQFDFSIIKNSLEKAYKNQRVVKLSISVGPDSPSWIYEHGVPKLKGDGKKAKWPVYPYYLDNDYQKYYFKLIEKFGIYLRSLPKHLFDCISFVQVKTGCTGDEAPYKGELLDQNYEISNLDWRKFRIKAFNQYCIHFNNGKLPKIKLSFNCIDPIKYPEEYKWVNDHIHPQIGYGIKGSAYVRGHHLTGEKTFKKNWYNFLVNPQNRALFSAAEMDQTWTRPLYQINTPLGFYWGALSGLNTGLSSWNVTESALDYADNSTEVQNTFRFFNKHAKQVFPSTATAAYIIFHEGLDSQNTIKFPESVYGKAKKNNKQRYLNICNAYADRGAKMDDLESAFLGQVKQRKLQKGYNDAGWNIHEGNYQRWVTQINPDETSISLFRVRGKIDSKSSKYDRFARKFASNNCMLFKFNDEVFTNHPNSITLYITWLDKNKGSKWALNYHTEKGTQKIAREVIGSGDNTWKTEKFIIKDAALNQSGKLNSDFTIENTDDINDIFHGIEIDINR